MRSAASWTRAILALLSLAWLGPCSVNPNVQATGSNPPQVQHLYLTVTGVWLNASATAAPTDAGWVGQDLSTPVTIEACEGRVYECVIVRASSAYATR